jgi:alkylation response protein AidB-like acyl-CoA dehydrogenase
MAEQYASMRNLRFLLYEVFGADQLHTSSYYEGYDREAFDLALDAAKQISDRYLFPSYRIMDKEKARYENGKVITHPLMRPAIKAIAESGWISAHHPYHEGGQQMPVSLLNASSFLFYCSNANLASHPFLTSGAANLIMAFGSEELKATYLPEMFAGNWQGTMALTEPQAGSSLSDIVTQAVPTADGAYAVKGQKIYISGGDHSAADNFVHLLLARIQGAPAGTKGISLFVVPKFRPENGTLVDNHVTTAGIYGKMGQKGYVAAHLMLGEQGETKAFLVGEANRGLPYMFQMMNEARISTGLMATGTATAAYYASLQYANERSQGRHPSNKDLTQPPVRIIEHADVRRMLLFQKAIVEGSISLLMQCSYYADLMKTCDPAQAKNYHILLELLTPVAKTYPAEMGTQAVSQGMQVLGGAGYTDDFPLEQYYRDIRINCIYEGTTGIHGLDLLGRKVMMENGKAMTLLMQEVKTVIEKAMGRSELRSYAETLSQRVAALHQTTLHLIQLAMTQNAEVFLADATLYLEFFGTVVIGWQWLNQGLSLPENVSNLPEGPEKDFYVGKLHTLGYYFEYELPKTLALEIRLKSENRVTLETTAQFIN